MRAERALPPAPTRTRPARLAAAAAALLATACVHGGRGPGEGFYSAQIVSVPATAGAPDPAAPRAAVRVPPGARYPAVLYLDGSGCRSVVHLMHRFDVVLKHGYAVVALEKRGVQVGDDGQVCSREFREHDTRLERQRAAADVIARLGSALPGWNHELLVVAASEAATFSGAVAREFPEVRGLVLLGGGGWTQARELAALQDQRARREGATERERADADQQLRDRIRAIHRQPDANETWLGHSYRRWASYLEYDPLPDLLALDVPIYMANGGRDTMVPIASARAVVDAFAAAHRENLTAREYPALDHRWNDAEGTNHFPEVVRDLAAWVERVAPGADAARAR